MQAQTGRTYAQIINGRCHWLFTAADLPEWADTLLAVDVTETPPAVGDLWNGETFATPVKTAEELAAEAFATQIAADRAAAKQYAKLLALSELSPDQIQTWIDANVTNLATAQDAIKTLAIGLSILIRRELR